jgi:hypothetical protein
MVTALTSACGTTVPVGSQAGIGNDPSTQASSGGLRELGSEQSQPGQTTGSAPLTSAPGSRTLGPASTQPTESASGGSTTVSGTVRATGPLAVGVVYTGDDQALSTLGGNGAQSYGNERDNYVAYFKDLNAHGGLAGRQVRAEYFAISSTDTRGSEQIQQAMCENFTHDHPVVFVLSTLSAGIGDTLRTCLSKAKVGLISNSLSGADATTFSRFPTYVEPTGLRLDRLAAAIPQVLNRNHFFSAGAKVAVLSIDRDTFRRATNSQLVPALRKLGYNPTVNFVRDPETDASGAGSDSSAAVLKFRSAGVTHVIFLSPNGTVSLLFTNAAESQSYRPAYGFTSEDAIEGLVEGGFVQNPKQQLAKASGLGWQPWLDARLEDNPIRSRGNACFRILAKAGINYTASAARWHAMLGCDTVQLLEQAATLSGSAALTGQQLVAVLPRLGAHHGSLATFNADFSARRDAAASVRYFHFEQSCTCFRYSPGDVPVA